MTLRDPEDVRIYSPENSDDGPDWQIRAIWCATCALVVAGLAYWFLA